MIKARILKQQDRCFIELPEVMRNHDELELYQLKEGYYLIALPLKTGDKEAEHGKITNEAKSAGGAGEKRPAIKEDERALLKKLLAIRFENRTPEQVGKALSKDEMVTLSELETRGLVNVFRGNKYKDGVYNINDSIYPMLFSSNQGNANPQNGEKTNSPATLAASAPYTNSNSYGGSGASVRAPVQSPGPSASIATLNSQGFLVVNDRNEERNLSEALAPRMKSGNVLGVMGFDGKLYIVTREYFSKAESRISPALKDDMTVDAIAQAGNLEPDGCRAVLRIMAENGDVIERRKGVFAPIN